MLNLIPIVPLSLITLITRTLQKFLISLVVTFIGQIHAMPDARVLDLILPLLYIFENFYFDHSQLLLDRNRDWWPQYYLVSFVFVVGDNFSLLQHSASSIRHT